MNKNKTPFKRFGTMIDCSRNAVMNVQTLKKWIDITADLGFNSFSIYMEDTYEIDNQPYFGYGRGRYSKEELKEINRYANSKGLEVIPCIQTLAHLNAITRWPAYKDMIDCNDILIACDEKVLAFIDDMFRTLDECFTSKVVNIGMDEAWMFGRGKYYDIHGDRKKSEIFVEHLNKVSEIGKKYGFTLCVWCDMFYNISECKTFWSDKPKIDEDVRKLIPDNVELVYWDYYNTKRKRYDKMNKSLKEAKEPTWFAGGLWCWESFAPCNKFSMLTTKPALDSCIANGVQNVCLTLWGDGGSECSKFATLPSLFYASEYAKGNKSIKSIREKFYEKFGVGFEQFMNLDLTGKTDHWTNPNKYILYNDLFTGLYDTTIPETANEDYKALSRKLALVKKNPEWGYIFESMQALCNVIALKADMGIRIRKAYDEKNMEDLKVIISDCKKLSKLVRVFHKAYQRQWLIENKGHGFDVQDIRIGGLVMRIESCTQRLEDLYNGKISKIEELEDKLLDIRGVEGGERNYGGGTYKDAVTTNVL